MRLASGLRMLRLRPWLPHCYCVILGGFHDLSGSHFLIGENTLRKQLELCPGHSKLLIHNQAQRREVFGPCLLTANKRAGFEPMAQASFFS